jgi:exodeoxyribonuclease-3
LSEEREILTQWEDQGWVDTFRLLHPEQVMYSYWDQITKARTRNVGWRIDYIYIDKALSKNLKEAFILTEVMGSDHCPVGIEIEL